MENATDALIMAGSVLLLILALSVNISSLSSLRGQVDRVIQADEQYELAAEEKENGEASYLNFYQADEDVRVVGIETMIPSIRRVRRENYTIYIYANNIQTIVSDIVLKDLKYIKKEKIKNGQTYIVKGKSEVIIPPNGIALKIDLSSEVIDNAFLDAIYKQNVEKKFKEYIGIYKEFRSDEARDKVENTDKIITYKLIEEE